MHGNACGHALRLRGHHCKRGCTTAQLCLPLTRSSSRALLLAEHSCIDSLHQPAANSAHELDVLVNLVAGSDCRPLSSPAAQHSSCCRSAARRRPCYQRRQQTSTHQWRRAARSPARAGTRGRLRDASLPTEAVFRPKLKPLSVNVTANTTNQPSCLPAAALCTVS